MILSVSVTCYILLLKHMRFARSPKAIFCSFRRRKKSNFGVPNLNEASFAITQNSSDGKQQGGRVINTEYLLQMWACTFEAEDGEKKPLWIHPSMSIFPLYIVVLSLVINGVSSGILC